MEMTQVKGVAITVGATAAFTALLTGSIVAVHNYQDKVSSIDTVEAFNDLQFEASTMRESGMTDTFSDHCLTLKEGTSPGATPLSWVPEQTESSPADPETGKAHTYKTVDLSKLEDSYDWQWINTDRDTKYLMDRMSRFYSSLEPTPYLPSYVDEPSKRSQDSLDRLLREVKASNPHEHFSRLAFVSAGAKPATVKYGGTDATPVIAAHCRWLLELKSNAVKHDANGSQLKDDVTVTSSPTCGDDEWLTVNGEKAHVTAHGRAYYTLEKPAKGNAVPAGATLIGEADLDFTAPGTQTATIDKPASLSGGYVTWVWSIEKNNQPSEWGKYLLQDATDGWAADDEVAEVPEAPAPSPSTTPSIPVSETPGTQPPAPSETQPTVPASPSEPSLPQPPSASLAHTGTTFLPLVGMSVFLLAGGVVTVLRKRNTI